MAFKELAEELDKTLNLVSERRKIMDDANNSLVQLSNKYTEAVERAQTLRQELNALLNTELPSTQTKHKIG
jgi:hypothetical protein